MFYIVYETTNQKSGKYYIGVHKQAKDPWNEDGYYGSGNIILKISKAKRREMFFRETLYVFDNLDDAYIKEREIVTRDLIDNRNCYNLSIGGRGGNRERTENENQSISARVKEQRKKEKNENPEKYKTRLRNLTESARRKNIGRSRPELRNNRFRAKQVVAGNFLFCGFKEAGRFFGVSDNTIKKRVKYHWKGYYMI